MVRLTADQIELILSPHLIIKGGEDYDDNNGEGAHRQSDQIETNARGEHPPSLHP